jgi:hypothetical protein
VPDRADEPAELERRRALLYVELAQLGDFRSGSLNEVRRKCGKPNCTCAAPRYAGHGPQSNLMRKSEAQTRTTHLRPEPDLGKAWREVAEYKRFRDLVAQVTGGERGNLHSVPGRAGRRWRARDAEHLVWQA